MANPIPIHRFLLPLALSGTHSYSREPSVPRLTCATGSDLKLFTQRYNPAMVSLFRDRGPLVKHLRAHAREHRPIAEQPAHVHWGVRIACSGPWDRSGRTLV